MKTIVAISLVATTLLLGGAVVNKQFFSCDKRFLCIDITPAPDANKPG